MIISIQINSCTECRHWGHSGAFTKGGAKAVCDHDVSCEKRGYDWRDRIIKTDKIPEWCPLKFGAKH